jgi:hypothetical protein
MKEKEKLREILVKKPFLRVSFEGGMASQKATDRNIPNSMEGILMYDVMTQADFMREFSPSGHKINDPVYYPNRIKYEEKDGKRRFFEERVVRCSFPFQTIIAIKHLCHLCGNDIQFELSTPKEKPEDTDLFFEFWQGWLMKNMEVVWYEAAKSAKITGDCAIAFYLKGGKVFAKNLSYMKRDVLYPHYDEVTGKLKLFARTYSDYDEDNKEITKWCEVWDDQFLYRYKQGTGLYDRAKASVKEVFGLDGYELVDRELHNFSRIPIVYHRVDDGACWSPGQDSIDKYELAVSHLCQNNMAYAFPIMYLKGDEIEIEGDLYGAVKAITMGKEDDGGFLEKPDASSSFEIQLKILLQNIFTGTFTVLPPDVKSGDLPGVAIKLLYSPAVEKAMADAKEFNPFIDDMVKLFIEGYGIEKGKSTKYGNLSIFGWIKPYVHQNDTELFANASSGVQNGYLSKKSASEIATRLGYGKNYEWDRVIRERKEEQQADLLLDIKRKTAGNPVDLDLDAGGASGQNKEGNINVRTGNKHIYDENGNWLGRNNWEEWNETH